MDRIIPFPPRQFFEVHGSEFKLPPVCYLGQASVLRITHGVFFLGISKDPFNGFLPPFVQFPVLRRIADVVRQLLTAFPDMPLYGLYAVFGMGAQMAVGTVTNLGITFTAAVLAVLSCLSLRFLSHLIPFPNVPASPITPSSSFSLI